MLRRLKPPVVVWLLSFAIAILAMRYFLIPPPGLYQSQILALDRHRYLLLFHIAGGITAITLGLFQFMQSLRVSHPWVHRAIGLVYLSSVVMAGLVALWLSPDTPIFAADLLSESKSIAIPFLGASSPLLGYEPFSTFAPSQFRGVMIGFGTLSVLWPLTSIVAFVRARQRRYKDHRAWMIRSYSLTFAAVTVRLVVLPFMLLTRDPVVAVTCTFWSWVLNLLVAEYVIRSRSPI